MLTKIRHSRPAGLIRYHLYRDVLLAWPRHHNCNICHWRGRHFLTSVHEHVLCPSCGSTVRHRLVAAALALPALASRLRLTGTVLHFAPEYCLGLVFRPPARRYVRADFSELDCDVRQDATRLGFTSVSADIVVACDMLEHISDDRGAFREFHRVLRPGGFAILSVPQQDGDVPTFEDPSIDTPEQRTRCTSSLAMSGFASTIPGTVKELSLDPGRWRAAITARNTPVTVPCTHLEEVTDGTFPGGHSTAVFVDPQCVIAQMTGADK